MVCAPAARKHQSICVHAVQVAYLLLWGLCRHALDAGCSCGESCDLVVHALLQSAQTWGCTIMLRLPLPVYALYLKVAKQVVVVIELVRCAVI